MQSAQGRIPVRRAPRSTKPAAAKEGLSHNLLGQRLGRKGRDTRERILAAAERLLADPHGDPISLSAVARDASLGMTTLYLYFSDLTELLVAVLEPIQASAEQSYLAGLRTRWDDEALGERCLGFVEAFHAFWKRHSRILHLRNSLVVPPLDGRMVECRVEAARPIIDLVMFQMDADPAVSDSLESGMATALITGTERLIAVTTDTDLPSTASASEARVPTLLQGQARLLELAIRSARATARRAP